MRVLAILIVAGPLMAAAVTGAPVMADDVSTEATHPPLRLADFTARKDAYVQKADDEMSAWRDKIGAAGERAEAMGQEASAETKVQFNQIWGATQDGWRKLQVESAEGWEASKRTYERSVAELRVQWRKLHADDQD